VILGLLLLGSSLRNDRFWPIAEIQTETLPTCSKRSGHAGGSMSGSRPSRTASIIKLQRTGRPGEEAYIEQALAPAAVLANQTLHLLGARSISCGRGLPSGRYISS
jgi:hypothetical protein